jgi:hypothetical protein
MGELSSAKADEASARHGVETTSGLYFGQAGAAVEYLL